MAGYHVVIVARGGVTKSWHTEKAPDTQRMCQRAAQWNAVAVVRYWPSKKGWRVLDTSQVIRVLHFLPHIPEEYSGWRYIDTVYPSEDAAVMAAILLGG